MTTLNNNSNSQLVSATAYLSIGFFFERFAYYGFRVCIMLYLMKVLAVSDENTTTIYTVFSSAAYLLPLVVAPFLDFLLKPRYGPIIGGVIMFVGLLLAMIPNILVVLFAMLLISIGSSFSRLGTYSSIAHVFKVSDNRRDIAFGANYMMINLGALFSTTIIPFLAEGFSFYIGFGACALAALISSAVVLIGNLSEGKKINWLHDRVQYSETIDKSSNEPLDSGLVEVKSLLPKGEKRSLVFTLLWIYIANILVWMLYDFGSNEMYQIGEELQGSLHQFGSFFFLLLGMPFALVGIYFANKRKMKWHYLSLAVIALVCLVFAIIPMHYKFFDGLPAVVTFLGLSAVTEILFASFMTSYMTRLVPPKFTNIGLAVMFTSL